MQLNELRRSLKFNRELLGLVETLKNVAGSQYHLMEKEKQRFDEFMEAFVSFFRVVDLVDVKNPLVKEVSDVLGVVIITSDSGFMGGLNQGVIRAAFNAMGGRRPDEVKLIVIGEKGSALMNDQGRRFKEFPGIAQGRIYEQAIEVKNYLVTEVMQKRMGRVLVAYPRALSFSSQTIEVAGLLPCGTLFDRNAVSEISRRGAGARFLAEAQRVVIESSFENMAEYLASLWVSSKLFEIFEDSKLAEFSARAMHLEGSHQKVEKEYKKVKHMCSKATHELIDKGMRESFSARAGKKKREKRQAA